MQEMADLASLQQHFSDYLPEEQPMRSAITAFTLALLAPVTAHTQDSKVPFDLIPQISVVGRGEIKVSPDRATIQISVQTRAVTAASAAAENATKQQAVLSALKALGLTDDPFRCDPGGDAGVGRGCGTRAGGELREK